jgi:uncharacterized protein (DUF1015 family)
VTVLRGFPGLVIDTEWADRVTTGPYDAYTPKQRAALAEANPYSFLHVTRSQEDVPVDQRDDIDALIAGCSTSMQRIYDAGAYATHDRPSLFLYRMEVGDHSQTGILGIVPVTDSDDRRILRHESVRPGRADLLTRHLLEVGMSSSPISLTYRTDEALDSAIASCTAGQPILESTSEGVHQTVWAVAGEDADVLIHAMGDRTLYVTDGHHRLAAAEEARNRVAPTQPDHPLQWTEAVLFPDAEMLVLPFHRRVGDRAGRSGEAIIEALTECGHLQPRADAEDARPTGPGTVGVYVGGRWFSLELPAATGARAVDRLDVSRLQDGVLAPAFGITDPGSDPMIDYIPEPVGLAALVRRCDADGRVGFVVHATSVAELMAVADDNDLMPPKSSYFEPKPRSGVFVRRLDREGPAGTASA